MYKREDASEGSPFKTAAISLIDLDGDGDLDAMIANRNQGNRVWLNSAGVFTDSRQRLGTHDSLAVSLSDLDGDGDADCGDRDCRFMPNCRDDGEGLPESSVAACTDRLDNDRDQDIDCEDDDCRGRQENGPTLHWYRTRQGLC